jgi:hypothetical protein
MAYSPIAFIAPNYRDYGTYWLKAYTPGSTSPKTLSIDLAGITTFAKLQLNVDGFFRTAGGALITPYIDGSYDAYLFQTIAEADANDTAGAVKIADNITPITTTGSFAFTTTTVGLIATTGTFSAETIITTSGYTPSGDGGTGRWKQNGVTGQTISQSPAQLGSAILNDGLGNQWALVGIGAVNGSSLGMKTSTDSILSLNAAKALSNGGAFHKKLEVDSGRYSLSTQFLVDEATDPASTVDHRNFILQGQGGFGTEPASELRGTQSNASESVVRLDSITNLQIKDIAITSNELLLNSVLRLDAGDDPAFSAHVGVVEGCYFNSFTATPGDAVVKVVNGKNRSFENNWIGVPTPSDIALKVGGLASANTTKLQQGEENCFNLENNFIFGKVVAERMLNFSVERNTFVENYGSQVTYTAGGIMHCGHITANYFTGVSGDTYNLAGIVLPPETADVEGNTCINITENRFRYRPIGVQVQTERPVNIYNNFARVGATDVFIQIESGAANVTVGANDFSNVFAVDGARGLVDNRHVFGTDQPSYRVDRDIVADWVLTADATSISATNTTQTVGSVTGVHLRGGKYRIRCSVPVRNTTTGKPLLYTWSLRYRSETGVVTQIGIGASGSAPDFSHLATSNFCNGNSYIERIVYLPPTTLANPATSAFELYVKNVSSATINSGFVDGNSSELTGVESAFFQVEEYRD